MPNHTAMDPSRRRWLRADFAAPRPAPCLPWLDAERCFAHCTRCGACTAACPEGIVAAGDGGFPAIDFARGGCTFCGACAAACPADLFAPERRAPWHARVVIGEGCMTHQRVYCQSCCDACEARAIGFAPALGTVPRPVLDDAACTACGACIGACPVGAIAWIDNGRKQARAGEAGTLRETATG